MASDLDKFINRNKDSFIKAVEKKKKERDFVSVIANKLMPIIQEMYESEEVGNIGVGFTDECEDLSEDEFYQSVANAEFMIQCLFNTIQRESEATILKHLYLDVAGEKQILMRAEWIYE